VLVIRFLLAFRFRVHRFLKILALAQQPRPSVPTWADDEFVVDNVPYTVLI
jgi:hypothetical protein